MLSSITEFPRDEFITCIKNKGQGFQEFLSRIRDLNTQWIYETIKHLYNALIESKQDPQVKLTALKLIKAMLETCEIPCLTLIEVYLLPTIYQISIYKPQQTGPKRGERIFSDNGYSTRIQNIKEIGIQFVRLSTQILYVGNIIKKKRVLEVEELEQDSEFVDYYQKFKKYAIAGSPVSEKDLRYFDQKVVQKLSDKYRDKLKKFQPISQSYSTFFLLKMIQSLQSQENVLFTNQKSVSSLSNDLDMKKLLKYGDAYITSPLLQQISQQLLSSQNFITKKNFLSLFTDFIKWADIEAIIQLNYDDFPEKIAGKIAEVDGNKGLAQGQNIYPQIKGQREGKKKFYIQFLKSLQIWAKLIHNDVLETEQSSKSQKLYQYFKNQRKFIFPDNLMLKRIQQDFEKSQQFNQERNNRILERLRGDESSLLNTKKSHSLQKKSISQSFRKDNTTENQKMNLASLKELLDQRLEDFITLCDEDDKIHGKMKKLTEFKNNFDDYIENINEDPDEDELMQLLDDGDALAANLDSIMHIYNDYKNKKITLDKFRNEFQNKLEELESKQNSGAEHSKSRSRQFNRSQTKNNQQSFRGQQHLVLTSLNNTTDKNPDIRPVIAATYKQSQSINNIREQFSMDSSMSKKDNSFYQKNPQNNQNKFMTSYGESNNMKSEQNDYSSSMIGKDVVAVSGQLKAKDKISRLNNNRSLDSSENDDQNKKSAYYEQEEAYNSSLNDAQAQAYYKNNDYYPQSKDNLNTSKKSIKQMISQHRSNRGDISNASRKSHKRDDSIGSLNRSGRKSLNESIREKVESNRLKNSISREIQKQSSIVQNYVEYKDQQYEIIKKNDINLKNSAPKVSGFSQQQNFSKNSHSSHSNSQSLSSSRNSKYKSRHSQYQSQHSSQISNSQIQNKNKLSQSRRSNSSRNSGTSRSRSRPKIFNKSNKNSRIEQKNLSSLINQDRNAVIQAYAINKEPISKNSQFSQSNQKFSSPNNSKHLSHAGRSSHEEYSEYMGSHSLTNKSNMSNNLSKNEKSDYKSYHNSKKNSRVQLTHEEYHYPEEDQVYSKMSNKRSLKSGNKKMESNYINNPDENSYQIIPKENRYIVAANYEENPDYKDQIREPQIRQLNESYHGFDEIQSRIRQKKAPSFKECFQMGNEVIPVTENKQALINRNMDRGNLFRKQKSSQPKLYEKNQPQEEYLMMKLRKACGREKNIQIQGMEENILKLKTQNSRLKSQLSSRSVCSKNRDLSSNKRSSSNNSQQFHQFQSNSRSQSNSNSHRSESPSAKSSRSLYLAKSKQGSITSLQGRLINMDIYQRYFLDYKDEITKRSLLRNKTLILKNEDLEIGCLLRKDEKILKIMVYITPQKELSNINWTITKERNLSMKSHPKNFDEIPEKRQVKMTIAIEAKAFPYNLPKLSLTYEIPTTAQKKSIDFYLPCPIHKFAQLTPPKDPQQFQNIFLNQLKIMRTDEFKVNKKVARVSQLSEYFSGLSMIRKEENLLKYGTLCKFGQNQFWMMFSVQNSNRLVIQGITHSQPQFVEYFMSSLKQIMKE